MEQKSTAKEQEAQQMTRWRDMRAVGRVHAAKVQTPHFPHPTGLPQYITGYL